MKARVLLLVCVLACPAYADSIRFTINFSPLESVPAGAPGPTGSFIYDTEAPAFREFFITTPNGSHDLTSIANSLSFCTNCTSYVRGPVTCGNGQTGAAAMFDFIIRNCLQEGPFGWTAGPSGSDRSFFHWYSDGNAGSLQILVNSERDPALPVYGAIGSAWTITQVPELPAVWLLLAGFGGFWGYGFVSRRTFFANHPELASTTKDHS